MISEVLNRSNDPRGPLITVVGASGFIGSALVAELARTPVRLRAVSRREAPVPAGTPAAVEVRRADLARPGEVRDAVEGADAVVHLAAHIGGAQSWRAADERSARVNVGLLHDLVDAFRGRSGTLPAVVFASTLQAGADVARQGAYARQKSAAEEVLLRAASEGVVRGVVLRLPTVYGRSPLTGWTGRGVVASVARRAVEDGPVTMWHDGTVGRDLLHVEDAARAFVAALDHAARLDGGTWSVGTGRLEPLGEVFSTIAGLVSERTGRPPVPVVSTEPPDHAEAGDFDSPVSDPSAFRAVTGWSPRVPLQAGLSAVVETMVAAESRGGIRG
ncbi:NAD-dependent epimerase/dehydratase family protein [Streptomyces spiramyceticus]|uniref:NDP-hexose ketoreductase n=1 Tax=Streptomyces spiramyceticus TaxID=299717 RepID=A0A411PXF4_9ACTN|nr:NAD-dependent epimerase/dehydratase family protein [Streptomyces spiramyceticus]QBG49786.1 NDP-hexose ketoreductase [Streptomyces spiramyceticus]